MRPPSGQCGYRLETTAIAARRSRSLHRIRARAAPDQALLLSEHSKENETARLAALRKSKAFLIFRLGAGCYALTASTLLWEGVTSGLA
jgi:hypothetical protein